ncbi:GIY-YIG nuclease family protein [Streptomyces sp. NPDC002853]
MTLKIYRQAQDEVQTVVPLATALDDRLSYAARGVLLEILTRPDDWDATADDLSQTARAARGGAHGEGRRAIRGIFAELESVGYMRRTRHRRANGEFFTILEVADIPNSWDDLTIDEPRPPLPPPGQSAVVYAIGERDSSIVKIGTTENARSRLRQIQTGHPHKLHVRWSFGGSVELEDYLHKRFDHLRLEGEWFDFRDADPVTEISKATDAYYLAPSGTCVS